MTCEAEVRVVSVNCERCGQVHTKCKAHSKRGGGPCGGKPMPGQAVCYWHGGSSPQALAAAEPRIAREVALGAVGELLEEMGLEPVPDPLTGLEIAYAHAFQMTAALRQLVGEQASPLGLNRFDEQVIHPLTELYGEWLDRYARIQKQALDAGIDERRTRMAATQGERLFSAVGRAVQAAGLNPEQEAKFNARLASELRQLAA